MLVLAVAAGWPLAHAGTALVVERDIGPPDAIVMLASHEWERLPAAAALARRHPAAKVLLTEPVAVTVYNCHRCSERVAWLEAEGVLPQRVRVLRGAANTYSEAILVADYARLERLGRVLIITSPYHTRRALATFGTAFASTTVKIGVLPASPGRANASSWWLDPYDRHYVRYEWAAIVKYRLQYGVPIM